MKNLVLEQLTQNELEAVKGGTTNNIHCEWWADRSSPNGSHLNAEPMGTMDSNGQFNGVMSS